MMIVNACVQRVQKLIGYPISRWKPDHLRKKSLQNTFELIKNRIKHHNSWLIF